MNLAVIIIIILSTNMLIKCVESYETVVMPCDTDIECEEISTTSKCINGVCECTDNCKLNINETVVTKIGESCLKLTDCNVGESYCFENKCTCKKGMVNSADKKKCLEVSKGIESHCIEDAQCHETIPLSVCVNNKCACGSSMQLHKNLCIANRTLGESCTISEECSSEYSECNVYCKCIKRYIHSGHRCLLISNTILSPCIENIQCEMTLGGGSICVNGLCDCRDLYQYKSSSNKCIRDILLNEVCATNEECHQPGHGPSRLQCILGQCKCRTPYFEINDYCISGAASDIRVPIAVFISIILSPYLIL